MKDMKDTKHDPTPIRRGGPPAPSRILVPALAALALLLPALSAAAGSPSPDPQAPNFPGPGVGKPTPTPGLVSTEVRALPDLVPVLDSSDLVRDMATAPVRVAEDGRTENLTVLPLTYCAGLSAGASKNVRLPNITWGVKNVALLGESTSPFRLELIWPGQPEHTQMVQGPLRMQDGEKTFEFPRPEPRTIQVTLRVVPALVRPARPVPTPRPQGAGTSVQAPGDRPVNPFDLQHQRCVSNILVRDPVVTVQVDDRHVIAESNETNNQKGF